MNRLFYFLGDGTVSYRKLMAEHQDFYLQGQFIPKSQCVIAEQTHSSHTHICTLADGGSGWDSKPQIMDTDALVTNVPNLFLLSRTADCTPILLHDPLHQAVGAVHSGREGTRKNIIAQTIKTMQTAFRTDPAELQIWIGASICTRHYQVSEVIWKEFTQSCQAEGIDPVSFPFRHIDIRMVIHHQLWQCGVKPANIFAVNDCTFETEQYFSYRRTGTHDRQINLIGIIDG
jgi:YfiH family protein